MKRLIVLLASLLISGAGITQQVASQSANVRNTVDLHYRDMMLADALNDLARRTGMELVYLEGTIPNRKVNVSASAVKVADAFGRLLQSTGARAVISGSKVSIVGSSARGSAQGVIAGKVIDAKTGKGVNGASVSVASRASASGEDGSYRITGVSVGTHTLTVRLVGYAKQTRTVTVGEGATVISDFKLEPSANVLDQVVVTGTVVQTELKAVPSAITVITAKQIEERGITRIDQLFRGDVPGLFSLNMGSSNTLDQVTMFSRGATSLTNLSLGSQQKIGGFDTDTRTSPIKTYLDGVELADPQYISQIDPKSIERIEILSGPQASTIYGAGAINGVMQIFTKRGNSPRPKVSVSLSSSYAQNNFNSHLTPSHFADGTISGMEGRVSYNVGGTWNYAGAWSPGKQTQRMGANAGARVELGKFNADGSARRSRTQNKQTGTLLQIVAEGAADGMFTYNSSAAVAAPQAQSAETRTMGVTVGYRPFSWWSHSLNLGNDNTDSDAMKLGWAYINATDTAVTISRSTLGRTSQTYNTTLQVPIASMARLDLTLGGDHTRSTGSSYASFGSLALTGTLSNVSVTRSKPSKNSGAFVQGQLGLMDALFLTYGVRADWNPSYGDDATVRPGRYGVSYSRDLGPVSAKLRGSYGRSIRPPAAGLELAVAGTPGPNFAAYDRTLANPDLGPEFQQGGEGGVEVYLGSRASLVVTRYNQTVDNLIATIFNIDSVRSLIPTNGNGCEFNSFSFTLVQDEDGYCFKYQYQNLNVGSIRNQGWEFTGSINTGPLSTRGTYSWNKSRILGITQAFRSRLPGATTEFAPGRPFNYMAEHTWALSTNYAHAASNVSLSINGIGKLYKNNDPASLTTASSLRYQALRTRFNMPTGYRSIGKGYATADLNAAQRFSSRMDATLQVTNLTNHYQNDYSVEYATIGRQTRAGLRIKM